MATVFQIFCCSCYQEISRDIGGLVFSCGEYICKSCSEQWGNRPITECPSCRKKGIKLLSLKDNLPDEISKKMSDCTNSLTDLQDKLIFQTKYYKQFIKKLTSRCNEQQIYYQRKVKELETQLYQSQKSSRHSYDTREETPSREQMAHLTQHSGTSSSQHDPGDGHGNLVWSSNDGSEVVLTKRPPSNMSDYSKKSSLLNINSSPMNVFGNRHVTSSQTQIPSQRDNTQGPQGPFDRLNTAGSNYSTTSSVDTTYSLMSARDNLHPPMPMSSMPPSPFPAQYLHKEQRGQGPTELQQQQQYSQQQRGFRGIAAAPGSLTPTTGLGQLPIQASPFFKPTWRPEDDSGRGSSFSRGSQQQQMQGAGTPTTSGPGGGGVFPPSPQMGMPRNFITSTQNQGDFPSFRPGPGPGYDGQMSQQSGVSVGAGGGRYSAPSQKDSPMEGGSGTPMSTYMSSSQEESKGQGGQPFGMQRSNIVGTGTRKDIRSPSSASVSSSQRPPSGGDRGALRTPTTPTKIRSPHLPIVRTPSKVSVTMSRQYNQDSRSQTS